LGDLFQISNQNSLGLSEDEIIQNLHAVTKEIIKMERMERNELLIDSEDEIKDKVYRAYGILANAHMISTQEAMKLLSIVRMGIDLNVIDRVPAETLNHLMINIQPATLTLMYQIDSDEKTGYIPIGIYS
jgi:protein arginine kinase